MKKGKLFVVLILFSVTLMAQKEREIFGTITDGRLPLQDVKITNLETDKVTVSNETGKYSIAIETGNSLQFSHTGFKTITIKIEDVTRVLNPIMTLNVTELDEVVVTKNRRESQQSLRKDYLTDKRIVRTLNGFMNTDWAVGFVQVIGKEEFSPVDNCILGVLKNRSTEVSVEGSCNGSIILNDKALAASVGYVYVNSNSFAAYGPAVYDVDGELYLAAPIFLDIRTIKRIAILNDKAARIMYGAGGIASGGVIVINTHDSFKNSFDNYDEARLTDNFLNEKVLKASEVLRTKPNYLKDIEASEDYTIAKEKYYQFSKLYQNSPYFFLDAYIHFLEEREELEFADEIISKNFELFENNPVLLKALAYTYEEKGRFEKAHELYKEAFILRPNYAQSYLDLTNSYRNVKEPKQAASIYARYEYLLEEGLMAVDTVGFGPIIRREFNNLLMLEKETVVKGLSVKNLYVADEDFEGTRLVFEWNDSEAEFDLQFVNPGNQYFKWNHSLADNSEVIKREKEFGYNVTEYLMDGALPGIWKVNVNYLGNKSLSPTYLKATVYHNYGSKAQRKEVKVFKLMLKNINQELFKLNISASLSSP